ncbi:hypothetical protein D3C72_1354580 [compost metagenome]
MPAAVERELDAIVHQPLFVQARGHAGALQRIDGDAFEDAGADAPQYIVGATLLDDDVVDPRRGEQLPEQQAGGAGADDGNLGAHVLSPCAYRSTGANDSRQAPAKEWTDRTDDRTIGTLLVNTDAPRETCPDLLPVRREFVRAAVRPAAFRVHRRAQPPARMGDQAPPA